MAMPVSVPTYTTDDIRAFPPDGCRYELVNGFLLVTPQPANAHQVVVGRLFTALSTYLGEAGPAVAVTPGEIELAPSVHLEPDVLVYPARFPPGAAWTALSDWWLAVEVSGRASRRYDRDFKRNAYLALGVREVWLVDMVERCVLVSRRDGQPRDVRFATQLTWDPRELPVPFQLDVARLLRDIP